MDTLDRSAADGHAPSLSKAGSPVATTPPATETGAGSIRFESVRKSFGNYTAVDDVSIHIRGNEFFTLLGPSGCGKTTLLRMLAGFESPSAGRILLGGKDIAHLPANQRPINTVFQNYALFPHMTVAQNVGFGLRMLKRPKAEIAAVVSEMLGLVRLEDKCDRLVTQLSGGQQQRVALARALAAKPQVLLLDEPLSALDLKLRKSMQIELKRLQEKAGITFIFVTHDQEEALTMSDRIAVMDGGRIQQVGTAREIYDHPANRFVAGFIGETNFLRGELVDAQAGTVRLACGPTIAAALSDSAMRGAVTIAVRPEHVEIVAPDAPDAIAARVEHRVYFGTDTHIHVRLPDGTELTIRRQNLRNGRADLDVGDVIGVAIPANAAQILGD